MKTALFKERDYIFDAYGLKPYTTYYLYVNNTQISSRTKQFGKKLGQPLVTNENGQLKVVFYIDSFIPSSSIKSPSAKFSALKAGPLEIVLSTINQANLPGNYADSAGSIAKTTVFLNKV
jgi:hypothetical protein